MVAEYTDNDSGSTVLDSSGKNNHGTLINSANPPEAPKHQANLLRWQHKFFRQWIHRREYVHVKDSPTLSIEVNTNPHGYIGRTPVVTGETCTTSD